MSDRKKPAHYRGSYHVRSRALVAAAKANPATKCWRCGLTILEHEPHKSGRAAYWTAGHVRDGDPTSPLLPEASTCNYIAGARLGAGTDWKSTRRW
jgi:hypothetical protein